MKKLFVALAILLPVSADAEPSKPSVAFQPVKQDPCAQYGSGFIRVAGTNTCVKVGGSASIGVGTTR